MSRLESFKIWLARKFYNLSVSLAKDNSKHLPQPKTTDEFADWVKKNKRIQKTVKTLNTRDEEKAAETMRAEALQCAYDRSLIKYCEQYEEEIEFDLYLRLDQCVKEIAKKDKRYRRKL